MPQWLLSKFYLNKMQVLKGKIWHYARFLSLIILIFFFFYSLFSDIKIKLIFFSSIAILSLILSKLQKYISILFKIFLLSISIIIFKFVSNFFSYGLSNFQNHLEFDKLTAQILNISNSLFFSYLFFKIYPIKNINSLNSINNLVENISRLTYKKIKDEKLKIKSISSIFATIIWESYEIFFSDEE